jgi:hypothetical protein
MDRISLIMRRGCWAGQIIDFIDFDIDRVNNIMLQDSEAFAIAQMMDIAFETG